MAELGRKQVWSHTGWMISLTQVLEVLLGVADLAQDLVQVVHDKTLRGGSQ